MFLKEFEVRWSDLDPNRHLANASYVDFMTHTRMSALVKGGFTQKHMAEFNIGPVVFFEHIYYFKEILADTKIQVSLEVKGASEDRRFFEFLQNFYSLDGENLARCEIMGGWMSLKERRLTALPDQLFKAFQSLDKHPDFKILTKEDTRKFAKTPKPLV